MGKHQRQMQRRIQLSFCGDRLPELLRYTRLELAYQAIEHLKLSRLPRVDVRRRVFVVLDLEAPVEGLDFAQEDRGLDIQREGVCQIWRVGHERFGHVQSLAVALGDVLFWRLGTILI